jgi:hypothetical protein
LAVPRATGSVDARDRLFTLQRGEIAVELTAQWASLVAGDPHAAALIEPTASVACCDPGSSAAKRYRVMPAQRPL